MYSHSLTKGWSRLATGALFILLGGCAAINTSVEKSDLDVQTRASESIFLEPVAPSKRIIFVSVRNTSDKDLEIKPRIVERLQKSGYQITDDPEQAHFMLQANVLKVGKDNQEASDSYLEAGVSGAAFGNAVSSSSDTGKGIVLGALAGVLVDALVDDTLYTMVTDLQVRERPRANEVVSQQQNEESTQGSDTSVSQSSNLATVEWKTYHTRIVSTANQVNLEFEDALVALEDGLIRSISGFFAE
ncbi:MAG: complement resistance protein TraT [Pseudomonadota bacterium]